MADWLGYTLYVRGPWWIMRRDNAFVSWCLRHAGAWAYRDHDFGDDVSAAGRTMSDHRADMLVTGPLKDPVQEMLRKMIAEFGDEHYHTCPADTDSGPCECFAGHLLSEARRVLRAAVGGSGT